jgi:hypothetical protein
MCHMTAPIPSAAPRHSPTIVWTACRAAPAHPLPLHPRAPAAARCAPRRAADLPEARRCPSQRRCQQQRRRLRTLRDRISEQLGMAPLPASPASLHRIPRSLPPPPSIQKQAYARTRTRTRIHALTHVHTHAAHTPAQADGTRIAKRAHENTRLQTSLALIGSELQR